MNFVEKTTKKLPVNIFSQGLNPYFVKKNSFLCKKLIRKNQMSTSEGPEHSFCILDTAITQEA
jgi:hypothetical protein